MTRLTVHVPPSAPPTSGPARKSIHGASAAVVSMMAASQVKSTQTSAFFGPTLSEA